MNRAQKRAAIKRGLALEYLKQERQDATLDVVRAYSAAVAMVLRDKLGFGVPKIRSTLKQIENLFDSINRDYLAVNDIIQTLEEELDMKFK